MERKAWPYVAGLMDSEGCIGIYPSKRQQKKNDGTDSYYYALQIIISNQNKRIMKWLVANFGGQYALFKNTRGYSKNNPGIVYNWQIFGGVNKESFLLGMLPYLITKKEQAKKAIDFLRLGHSRNQEARKVFCCDLRKLKQEDGSVPFKKYENSLRNAYAAGLIDGDGTISSSEFAHDIIFYSTNFNPIKWMLAHFGGHFYTYMDKRRSKPIYRWCLSGRANKEKMLLCIIPYLIIKRERAKVLLKILRAPKDDRKPLLAKLKDLNCPVRTATTETINTKVKTQPELSGD